MRSARACRKQSRLSLLGKLVRLLLLAFLLLVLDVTVPSSACKGEDDPDAVREVDAEIEEEYGERDGKHLLATDGSALALDRKRSKRRTWRRLSWSKHRPSCWR